MSNNLIANVTIFVALIGASALALLTYTANEPLTLQQFAFVQKCGGTTHASRAIDSCMGRMRGLVDGHSLTTATYKIPQQDQLWCVAPSTTNKELLTTVLDWVDDNQEEYARVVAGSRNAPTASLAVAYLALTSAYPCATT